MSDVETDGHSQGGEVPSDPLGAALAVLRDAERIRDEAERNARLRENEADLLVQKARRVLLAAEAKATAIVATARSLSPRIIDLDAAAAATAGDGDQADLGRLDGMLASAITNAVSDAFPGGATV